MESFVAVPTLPKEQHDHDAIQKQVQQQADTKPENLWAWIEFVEKRKAQGTVGKAFFEKEIDYAIMYLESVYSLKFGFLNVVSSEKQLVKSTTGLPNIFDTSLILGVLGAAGISLSEEIINHAHKMILKTRSPENLFNFFFREYSVLPDDIDTSSVASLALYHIKSRSVDIAELASNFLDKVTKYGNGIVDVYFPKKYTPNFIDSAKWPAERKRIDVGVTSNFLTFLSVAKVEHESTLLESYAMIDTVLTEMEDNNYSNPVNKYYQDIDVLCLFVSKLIVASEYARKLFGEKFAKFVKGRLLQTADNPVSLACRIIAAVNSGLYDAKENRMALLKEASNLLLYQNPNNYSFPEYGLYNAQQRYYFGSKAMSTALSVSALKMIQELEKKKHVMNN